MDLNTEEEADENRTIGADIQQLQSLRHTNFIYWNLKRCCI